LAEVGSPALEIMAVPGHKSLAEVERYTRAADQKRMSTAAQKLNHEWQAKWQTEAKSLMNLEPALTTC